MSKEMVLVLVVCVVVICGIILVGINEYKHKEERKIFDRQQRDKKRKQWIFLLHTVTMDWAPLWLYVC